MLVLALPTIRSLALLDDLMSLSSPDKAKYRSHLNKTYKNQLLPYLTPF